MRDLFPRQKSSKVTRGLLAVPLLLSLLVTPAIANTTDIDRKVAQASEALSQASKAVLAAAASLKEVQAKLPGARQALATANAVEVQATATYKSAAAQLVVAKAAYVAIRIKVTSKEAEISQLQIKVDQFARAVYQQGPTSQWEIILQSESPSDLTIRLQNIKAVSASTDLTLDELVIAKDQLAIDAAEAEAVRLEMQRIADIASQALIDAKAAADRAAAAKAEVDRLVKQESR